MTKKELSRYYFLSLEVKYLEQRIKLLHETAVGASNLTGMPKATNVESPVERRTELILKLEKKLEKRKNQATEEMCRIEEYISTIEDIEIRLILSRRYIDHLSWEKIAVESHMSERNVQRIHSKFIKSETCKRELL